MRTPRIFMATTSTVTFAAAACTTPPEPSQEMRQHLTVATVAAAATLAPAPGPAGSPPRVGGASLRLLDPGTGYLARLQCHCSATGLPATAPSVRAHRSPPHFQ
jgi:hypothetical protein